MPLCNHLVFLITDIEELLLRSPEMALRHVEGT
jgi:hypothetical protein